MAISFNSFSMGIDFFKQRDPVFTSKAIVIDVLDNTEPLGISIRCERLIRDRKRLAARSTIELT